MLTQHSTPAVEVPEQSKVSPAIPKERRKEKEMSGLLNRQVTGLEALRVLLAKNIFTPCAGFRFSEWIKLLWRHRFKVAPSGLPRALFITANSLNTSVMGRLEAFRFKNKIAQAAVHPPIFILGHWRSGTTYLHNLLSQDPRFAFPNFLEATQPQVMLSADRIGAALKYLFPKTRLIDNMSTSPTLPMEDEPGLFALCGLSPLVDELFPAQASGVSPYLTFRDASKEERERWKDALLLLVRKLSAKYARPLILKSPPHTCRIKLILEVFPNARFIHIHRNPYEVFLSCRKAETRFSELVRLQNALDDDGGERILQRYRALYDVFFEEQALIPKGQFFEVPFASLEQDPLSKMRELYQQLGLGSFDPVRSAIKRHVAEVADFKKTSHDTLDWKTRRKIASAWNESFERWGYRK